MKKTLTLIATLSLSLSAQADFIHTDWQTLGDEKATLDTDTGLEWLKLENTGNYSYNRAIQGINNGEFTGWRLPTNEEVTELYGNLFTTAGNLQARFYTSVSPEEMLRFRQYLAGVAVYNGTPVEIKAGFYRTEYDTIEIAGANSTFSQIAGLESDWGYDEDSRWNYRGVYLVSDGGTTLTSQNNPSINQVGGNTADVSSPGSLPLLSLGLIALARLTSRSFKSQTKKG